MPKFSIEEAVSFGWKTVKEQWTTLVPVVLLFGFVGSAIANMFTSRESTEKAWFMDGAANFSWDSYFSAGSGELLSLVISTITTGVLYFVSLKYLDGKKKEFKQLFQGLTPEYIVKLIGASILQTIIIGVGFILLIIPGIYFALRYSQVAFVLADKNCGVFESFTESSRLTAGVKWNLLGFFLVALLILLVGVLALFVGVIVAAPVVMVASAHVYNQLKKSAGKVPAVAEA